MFDGTLIISRLKSKKKPFINISQPIANVLVTARLRKRKERVNDSDENSYNIRIESFSPVYDDLVATDLILGNDYSDTMTLALVHTEDYKQVTRVEVGRTKKNTRKWRLTTETRL